MNDFDISLRQESALNATPQQLVPNSELDTQDLISGDSLSSSNSSMLPTLDEDVLRYEAEELNLSNYLIESNNASSGGKHISLLGSESNSGSATGVFNGKAGTYQVNVGFYDENDGVSSANVKVAGDVESFSFDKDLPANAPSSKSLTSRITHSEIELQQGDIFEIEAQLNSGEFARFDYIEFRSVGSDSNNNSQEVLGETNIEVQVPDSLITGVDGMDDATSQDSDSTDNTYYVSPQGSDDNPGTKDKPWKTIDYAVSKESDVQAGDTVLVQAGKYTELITLEKSGNKELGHITLKADGEVTLYDPDPKKGGFREGVIQSAGEGYWIIDGFRIENTSWAGIALRDANNMIVQNNHTFETGASGIIVLPETYYKGGDAEVTSKDIKVLDNKIERANWRWTGRGDTKGTQEALSIWGVDGFEVANNIVKEATREGIDIKTGSRNGSVHGNTVTGAAKISGTSRGYNGGPAIYVDGNRADSFNIDIYNNLVYGNVAEGITVADEEPSQGDVKDVRIYNNVVYGNGKLGTNSGAGIMVTSNVSDVEIINNTLANNVQSIVIDGTDFTKGKLISDVVVRNNIFAHPKYRNGLIEDAKNVVLDNNLFTNEFEEFYAGGKGLKNFKEENNIAVESINFADLQGKDYHISSDSPAINAGSDAVPDYASIDKDGERRNKDNKPDIGAYEYGDSV